MKVSEMLLWILGTSLLALFVGAHYWGEHQRREDLASFAEVRPWAPIDWMSDAHAGEAVPAGLPSLADAEAARDAVLHDVHVLDDTGEPMLTLVTCYPLYFVGGAPQPHIVRTTVADRSM